MENHAISEIARALAALADHGIRDAIDLRSLPLTPADRAELEQALGRGAVSASLDVAGPSEIWETGYPGVWWVRHMATGGQVAAETIEITPLPSILTSPAEDIRAAAQRLAQEIAAKTKEAAHG